MAKKLTEKATQIKTVINSLLYQEVASPEPKAFVKSPTVGLLQKFHLLTGSEIDSTAVFRIHQPDEAEGQPALKKMRL